MRRPLLFYLLLCLPLVFGATFLGEGKISEIAPLSAPAPPETKSPHVNSESSAPSDTADVHCPVGPKHGDATIRIDSTSADWSVKVEPDSHLVTEYKDRWGSKWKFYGLETTAHVNDDDHIDLTVNVGTTVISKNVNLYTDIFVGCGGNRYAVVGKRLLFDRFGSWDDGEEKWKTVYTKHDMEGRDPPLTYTKRYHFYREQEEYRIVPGSVWYTKRSADRLGFDYEDRPSCPAGSRLPVKLKPAGDGEKLSEGDRVKRKPFSKENLYVYWVGDLNNDEKSDLILERREDDSRTAKTIYSGCGKSFYSDLYFDISKSIKPTKKHIKGRSYIWKHIEESETENGKTDTVVFKWDDYRR